MLFGKRITQNIINETKCRGLNENQQIQALEESVAVRYCGSLIWQLFESVYLGNSKNHKQNKRYDLLDYIKYNVCPYGGRDPVLPEQLADGKACVHHQDAAETKYNQHGGCRKEKLPKMQADDGTDFIIQQRKVDMKTAP